MSELVELLDKVVLGEDGFKLGEPWTPSDNSMGAVVPILRDTEEEKDYYTLPEVKDRVELEDTGVINKVKINSKGVDKPIVVLAGEVFEGQGTQSRGVVHSIVVMPSEIKPIETRCVHATHGIRTSAKFAPVGLAPVSVTCKLMAGDQRAVWNSVSCYSSYSGMSSPDVYISTRAPIRARERIRSVVGSRVEARVEPPRVASDNLPAAMKKTTELMRDFLSKIPCFENQVGAIIIGLKGVEGIEMFDHPEAWAARYKDVMGKYAESISRESKLFKIDTAACTMVVDEFINSLKNAEVEVLEESEMFKILRIRSGSYVGEAVVLKFHTKFPSNGDGRVVHLFAVRHEERETVPVTPSTVYTNMFTNIGTAVSPVTHQTNSWETTITPYFGTRTDSSNVSSNWTDRFRSTPLIMRRRRGWETVLRTLEENPKGLTWSELQKQTGLNSVTLTSRLKEGRSLGVITEDLRTNGRKVYRLNL